MSPGADYAFWKGKAKHLEECVERNSVQLLAYEDTIRALKAELAPFRDTTAERDQLRAALALGQINCDAEYDDLRAERDAALKEAAMMFAALKACDGKVICSLAREELDAALRDAGEES